MIIKISDYKSRSDLEAYIVNEFGDNIDVNRASGNTIQGTQEELTNFGLSTLTRIYGMKVTLSS